MLPEYFCWTRVGTEAGQPLEAILRRKNEERLANKGIFFWGIGNAVGPSIMALVRKFTSPDVIFSPIRCSPRRNDVSPTAVAAWKSGETMDGNVFELPESCLITSRYDPKASRDAHYALVCWSDTPLVVNQEQPGIDINCLRNLLTNRSIGASQVTAVVRNAPSAIALETHRIAFRARLAPPFFIRLRMPRLISTSGADANWAESVDAIWRAQRDLYSDAV